MNEVDQEFLVTRTLQEMEFEKTDNMNFVGMYLSADDKVNPANVIASIPTQFSLRSSLASSGILSTRNGLLQEKRQASSNFHGCMRRWNIDLLQGELRWRVGGRRCSSTQKIIWYIRLGIIGQLQRNYRFQRDGRNSCYSEWRSDDCSLSAWFRQTVLCSMAFKWANVKLECVAFGSINDRKWWERQRRNEKKIDVNTQMSISLNRWKLLKWITKADIYKAFV